MPTILFVCRANVCRSPMAEGLMRRYLREGDFRGDWDLLSAGTWTGGGISAHPTAQKLLDEGGVDLGDHRSKEVTIDMLSEADLVLAMERGQVEALQAEFPEQAEKVHMLSELKGEKRVIPDPVGGGEEEFRAVLEMIRGYLEGSEERMRELMR